MHPRVERSRPTTRRATPIARTQTRKRMHDIVLHSTHLDHGQVRDGLEPRDAARDHFRHRNGPRATTLRDAKRRRRTTAMALDARRIARTFYLARAPCVSVRSIASHDDEWRLANARDRFLSTERDASDAHDVRMTTVTASAIARNAREAWRAMHRARGRRATATTATTIVSSVLTKDDDD